MSNHVLIENGIVIQSDRTGDAPEGFVEAPDHVVPGYWFVGSEFAAPVPSPPTLDDFKAAIVAYLDAAVQLRGYDSIHTAASYRDAPNELYSTEGWAAFSFRSRVWTYADAELKKVEQSLRLRPTISELIGELPIIECLAANWPRKEKRLQRFSDAKEVSRSRRRWASID